MFELCDVGEGGDGKGVVGYSVEVQTQWAVLPVVATANVFVGGCYQIRYVYFSTLTHRISARSGNRLISGAPTNTPAP